MFKRRDLSHMEPLDVCQADGHSFKSKVAHPAHGKAFHPEVEGLVDCVTRLCVGWSVGLSESGNIVADALLHAMTVNEAKPFGGIPAILYSDQGAGNEAKINTAELTGLFARVGIDHRTGIAGNPQGRGLIERSQGTIWIRAAKKLPTFTGRGMSKEVARKVHLAVEKGVKVSGSSQLLISWQEFLQFLAVSVERYNRTPHRGLPRIRDAVTGHLRHMSPLEAWASWLEKGWRPSLPSPEVLEDWKRPQKIAVVQRGLVSLFGNTYGHRDLEHYHGKKVIVEYDFHDGSLVLVRDLEGRLICKALFDCHRTEFYPVSAVEKARSERAKRRLQTVERKREEIELERRGPVAKPVDLTLEELETFERLQIETREAQEIAAAEHEAELAKLAEASRAIDESAARRPLWTSSQAKYEFLSSAKRRGEQLSAAEQRFMEEHEEANGFRLAANGKRPGGTPTAFDSPGKGQHN